MFLDDKNASVSEAVAPALAPILMKYQSSDIAQLKSIVKIVKQNFFKGNFKRRQLYLIMANEVMNLSKELFEEYFKNDFLSLVGDKVINVRIVLSRCLASHFRQIGTFSFDPLVNHAVRLLKQEKGSDIKANVSDIATI
jgi:hypothetical protein